MIKGSQLVGRAVIDMDAAEKLGKIKEILMQRDGERVAGFVVVHGETLLGSGGTRRTIPASALNAIGPDAIIVHGALIKDQPATQLDSLPRMSDVIGHKMVTQSGRLLGLIDDILIDGKDGTIIGFVVGEGVKSKLENIFSPGRARPLGYVRADADLQVGNDLIVVPDDAFVEGDLETRGEEKEPPPLRAGNPDLPRHGWAEGRQSKTVRSNIWNKRTAAGDATKGRDEVEGWIPGDFAELVPSEPTQPSGDAGAKGSPAGSASELTREQTRTEKKVDWTAPAPDTGPLRSSPLHPESLD